MNYKNKITVKNQADWKTLLKVVYILADEKSFLDVYVENDKIVYAINYHDKLSLHFTLENDDEVAMWSNDDIDDMIIVYNRIKEKIEE